MPARAKLDVINGLRGFALAGVIWHHLFGLYFKPGSAVALDPAPEGGFFLSYGWIGVQLFFVLSGFVLYLPYAEGRARLATGADAVAFYRRRAARLLPLYYLVVLLCLVFNQSPPEGAKFGAELVSMGLVLFPFTGHGFEPYLNPPLWSLGVEIWFSVLFPVVVLALQRFGALRLIAATLVIGCASRALGLILEPGAAALPLTTGLSANLEVFAAGMVLAQWYVNRAARPLLLAYPLPVAAIGGVLVAAAIGAKHAALPGTPVLFPDLLTLGLSLAIAGLLALKTGPVRAVFANRPIQLVGMMCYSLYVWHEPLLRHVFQADIAPLDGLAETLPVYLTLLAGVGALSYRFIEFGRVADWRTLFLIQPAAAMPQREQPVTPPTG
jgi:peptidoglycan/LPS O-acetylase OafA/YrhL